MNHLHGYHGSDVGRCLFCGSMEPESKHCEERSKEIARRNQWEERQISLVKGVILRASSDERNALEYVIDSYKSYNFGLFK